jgi:hypothetical protein
MTSIVRTLLLISLIGCTGEKAQTSIDKAITASGGEKYLKSTIEFDFRGRHYVATRDGGKFSYERIFKNDKDSTKTVHDYVTNDGFIRKINDSTITVADSMKVKYTASTNSVIYFALLPYGLNDAAVQKKYLGEVALDKKGFYKIHVSFKQSGGGEDFEDQFIYWIDKQDFTIGYLAYSYAEEDGIGYRLRKAYNPRLVNGILFLDYINYKPKGNQKLDELESLFVKNELEELSKIELENIVVR